METKSEIEGLVDVFFRDACIAIDLDTPNYDDDFTIKMAIVGFSYNAPTEAWCRDHFDFVVNRVSREYSDDDLFMYGDNYINVRFFYALCLGFILGSFQSGLLTEEAFETAEKQIPGVIMLHLEKITGSAIS